MRNGAPVMVPIADGAKDDPQALPSILKDAVWREWTGNQWEDAKSVKCRATFHGWGVTSGEQSLHNAFSVAEEVQRHGQVPARSRGRTKSPPVPRPRKV